MLDLGVSEAWEINGSPHPHPKGWINPNDWGKEGGDLRLGIRCLVSGLLLVAQVGQGGMKGQVSSNGEVFIWLISITPKFPDLKTQHSGGFVLVSFKGNSPVPPKV